MRILFVAAEASPIAKVGGMGDVVGALPKFLRRLGHDVRIFLPYYGFLPDKMTAIPKEPIWKGSAMFHHFAVYETVLPGTDVPLYLMEHPAFKPRRIYFGDDEDWRLHFFLMERRSFAGIIGSLISFIAMIGIRACCPFGSIKPQILVRSLRFITWLTKVLGAGGWNKSLGVLGICRDTM